jgi:hypothetical protein
MQCSSKALTISLDTCPKNAAETFACTGFENANVRSSVTSVGPVLCCPTEVVGVSGADGFGGGGRCPALAWGEFGEVDWNRHVVESVLKSGVEEDATACVDK